MFTKPKKQRKLRNNEYYNMQTRLDTLYGLASKGCQTDGLYEEIISKENILLAYRNIKKNTGSKTKGVDGKTIEDLKVQDIDGFICYIQRKFENYTPQAVRRVEIPKANGKTRPLGIPTMVDRVIQQCILQILEPICEAKFSDNSFGFRPNRSTEHAVARLNYLVNISQMHYCVDIDIKGFFDNVNHGKLLKQMWSLGIKDKRILSIISKILKSPIVLPDGKIIIPTKGTPQGGIISPLLSNIVLNELDYWIDSQWQNKTSKEVKVSINVNGSERKSHLFRRLRGTDLKEMYIVRYADDFKVFTNNPKDAQKIFQATKQWLKERLDLDISPEKSCVTNLRKNYTEFLGFKIKAVAKGKKSNKNTKYVAHSHISDKATKRITAELREHIKRIQHSSGQQFIKSIDLYNSKVMGIHNYYSIATLCNIDFVRISYNISKTLKNRLDLSRTGKNLPKYIQERYGKSEQLRYVNDKALIPVGYIQTKNAMSKKRSINKYTTEGRELIHKELGINGNILHYMIENPIQGRSIEYNDNRISLYCGQQGRCAVTGTPLIISSMHCHHKKPYAKSKNDSYGNLVLIQDWVHQLIHLVDEAKIIKLVKKHGITAEILGKVNKLRLQVNLFELV